MGDVEIFLATEDSLLSHTPSMRAVSPSIFTRLYASRHVQDFSDMAALNELYWRGFNSQGHPILVWNAARHDASGKGSVNAERYARYFVYLLETGARDFFGGSEKPGLFCIMFNARGVGRRNVDLAMMRLAGPIIEVGGWII
jgi:hypothetical protein